jgi:hypothetical protein
MFYITPCKPVEANKLMKVVTLIILESASVTFLPHLVGRAVLQVFMMHLQLKKSL